MKFEYLEEVNSTNTYAKLNIKEIEDKTIVYTSKQTNGRGRFDRKWVDLGNKNLYLSIVLKPSKTIKAIYSNLTQYTCLKLVKTFESYGISATIKWPNDILINDKKISGILAETSFDDDILEGIIIGVGINLNADKKDFKQIDKKVTSLNLEINKEVNKQEFLENFSNNFFNEYEDFLNKGFYFIKSDYEKYINFLGKEITIQNLGKTITGIAEKITNNGSIVINNKEYLTGDIL